MSCIVAVDSRALICIDDLQGNESIVDKLRANDGGVVAGLVRALADMSADEWADSVLVIDEMVAEEGDESYRAVLLMGLAFCSIGLLGRMGDLADVLEDKR
jgi:hypothetical protein